jgi:hypothetical protein
VHAVGLFHGMSGHHAENKKGLTIMKTIILWKRKRSRTFKQEGLATADGSATTIRSLWLAAAKGDGTIAIVDAQNVNDARAQLARHFSGTTRDCNIGVAMQSLDGRAVALGAHAVLAVAGASEACRHWDVRLRRDGRVKVQDTTALGPRSDSLTFTTVDAFGEGFR